MMIVRIVQLFVCLVLSSMAVAANSEANARYVIQDDRVHDRQTDLTWQRCTYGMRWTANKDCQGEPRRLTFDAAKKLESGGWRLPTLDELNSIVVRGRKPSIDETLFPNTPPLYFWATDNRDTTFSWYVLFENGVANHYFPPRTNRDLVRLVRTGKWLPRKP
jgi:hypothetical protein